MDIKIALIHKNNKSSEQELNTFPIVKNIKTVLLGTISRMDKRYFNLVQNIVLNVQNLF